MRARLRHAAGRSRPSGAGGDRADDARARRAGRRGRRARRPRASRRAAGELPRPVVRLADAGSGAARSSRRRSPPSWRARPAARCVAHMCPIYAVLAAPLARPLGVRLLLWYTHWKRVADAAAGRAASRPRSLSVDRRSFPLDSREGARDRARHRPRRVRLRRRARRDDRPARCSRSAATRPRRASRRSLRGCGSRSTTASTCGSRLHGPALTAEERAHRGELERLVAELDLGSA